MGPLKMLYLVELRRQWTVAAAFVPLGLLLLSVVTLVISAKFSKTYDVVRMAISVNNSMVVPLATVLFAVAMVAADVKEGWLRTLLIRPISRQHYLLVKMAAVSTSILITILIAGVLPNIVIPAFFFKGEVHFDFVRALAVHVIFLLEALQILSILAFLSCWLPGVFNVVLLAFWAMSAGIISGFLGKFYWSERWALILKECLYPPGFSSTVESVAGGLSLPYADLAWGLGATGIILALAFWSVTKIQVDKGSD